MEDAMRNFQDQFTWKPNIENVAKLSSRDKFIIAGMGGSALSAGLLKARNPLIDLLIHRDYGLPRVPDYFLNESLFIASSYSGNTEEVIDALLAAIGGNLHTAVLTTGGKLLEIARTHDLSYVQIPATGIQPRMALGYSLLGLLALMGSEDLQEEASALAKKFHPAALKDEGRTLAEALDGKVPVIYTSAVNFSVAYAWKSVFNETGKIPAFCNALPELNHNEMTGFDIAALSFGPPHDLTSRRALNEKFAVIILEDKQDDPRIKSRMELLKNLYAIRGVSVHSLPLKGSTGFEKIFSSVLLGSWAAWFTAERYGLEAEAVPMVEEFKRALSGEH